MKTLTIAEALIALGNGEKITSDFMETGYVHLVDTAIRYDSNQICTMINEMMQKDNLRIYEEFTYPMWFKNLRGTICKFTSLNDGECLSSEYDRVGIFTNWVEHTDAEHWEQVEEPMKMIKVAKYAFFSVSGKWAESQCYYRSDDDVTLEMQYKEYKRLDYTEIEVDDYE